MEGIGATGGILLWGRTFGGVYIPCIYSHARWSHRRRFRSLLLCPLSVELYHFPVFVDFNFHKNFFLKTHCFTENLHRPFRYCFHIKALTLPLLVCLWMADVWNTLQCQGQTELLRTRLFQASKHLHPKDNLPRAASPLALAICPSPFPVHLPAVSLIDLMDDKGNVLVS